MTASICPPVHSSSLAPAWVTFKLHSGRPAVVAAAWVGLVGTRPVMLSAGIRPGTTVDPLWRGEPFALNFPGRDWPGDPSLEGSCPARGPCPVPSDVNWCTGPGTGVPLLEGCPVRLECLGGTLHSRYGQQVLCGEVVFLHLPDSVGLRTLPSGLGPFAPFASAGPYP
ncbi:MAG: hypothetical protein C0617_00520 [Desulfuromonas sp.]|uniref:flavin reductase n=1 Tax=Desulfuromonas sp. TaxID=892 RepID=UPI000CC6379C|nr:flavin reductase [Desulfuromonas sp.]PLX86589.1 MAG: hypothetical protein C0617_00520 [Desulfuromonas sp.]